MNSNFDPLNKPMQPSPHHSSSLNALQRDRFELLSAYLDGEVTATERKQVEEWLATDASIQQLHARLMKLRQGFRALPTPAPSQSVEKTVDQVLARIDRRPNLRLVWDRTARNFAVPIGLAAVFVGAVTVFSFNRQSPQFAERGQPAVQASQPASPAETDGLMIALDRPVVTMPKSAVEAKGPAGVGLEHKHDAH